MIMCHVGFVFSYVVQSGTTDVVLHAMNSLLTIILCMHSNQVEPLCIRGIWGQGTTMHPSAWEALVA